jgi:predicted RNase H-like nuclease (RuvC/YqgF family)
LDLCGRLVASGCEKEASDERLVKVVSGIGIPVLVASDTQPASHFVQKVAARLNVRVFSPRESMSRLEKRAIGAHIEDAHARDSYAAAVKAYRRYQNRLRQIDSRGLEPKRRDELKKMVICGQRIADAPEA